jgi:cytochrome c-type biogenesis protein CcmH/NrfG
MTVLQRARAAAPGDPAILRLLGRAALAAGRRREAETAFRDAISRDPDLAAARVELARMLLEGGRPAEAAAECREALDTLPSYVDAAMLLAEAEWRSGEAAEATVRLADMLADDPYNLEGLLLLGRILLDRSRTGDARQAFQRVLRFDPDRIEPRYHLGVAAGEERRFREAIRWWRDLVERAPDHELADRARRNIETAVSLARVFSVETPAATAAEG